MHWVKVMTVLLLGCTLLASAPAVLAQDGNLPTPTVQWLHGTVTALEAPTATTAVYTVEVRLSETQTTVRIPVIPGSFSGNSTAAQRLQVGVPLMITATETAGQTTYVISDFYRTPAMVVLALLFFLLVILFGRRKGFGSILGLGLTVLVLVKGIVPNIAAGHSPVLVSIVGSIVILLLSFYVAHGFNKRITIALISSCVVLAAAIVLSMLATHYTYLSGASSEEVNFLQSDVIPNLNLKGLLLAGMIIGMLGVLDDITTGQAAVVEELHHANPQLPLKELYQRAQSVGREHIASLVNTLVLAYAGASLPLFLLFVLNPYQPIWTIVSSEVIVEEIVRALVGSTAIILAVPITTAIAAYVFTRNTK